MNRDEALALIREGRAFCANLTGADLSRADLTGANLTGADLFRADLSGADLFRADLTGATLAGADLTDADLTRASLTRASLGGVNLTGANLSDANLTGQDSVLLPLALPSGVGCAVATPVGWSIRIGCWTGSLTDLSDLIEDRAVWPEATGPERERRRPSLIAAHALVTAHANYHNNIVPELAELWGTTKES